MFGSPFVRSNGQSTSSPPSHFKDSARNAIYRQLPVTLAATTLSNSSITSSPSINSAPSVPSLPPVSLFKGLGGSGSSVFSKRTAKSAPSFYSRSTATIPEDSVPVTTTVEQLVNDVALHENYYLQQFQHKVSQGLLTNDQHDDYYKISLGSQLNYDEGRASASLLDWNLNVTRCKLMLTHLPMVSSMPDFHYDPHALPQLIGDLAQVCNIVIIQPHITDKELIYTLFSSNIYQEHNLDLNFKKSVAEISVKQSRLLQINAPKYSHHPVISADSQTVLKFKYKEIAIRNYLVNLAAAATTAYEYKVKMDDIKRVLKMSNKKMSKDEKKMLWNQVRLDVFRRAGIEE